MQNQPFILMEIHLDDLSQDGQFYVIKNLHEPLCITDENIQLKSFPIYLRAAAEATNCQDGHVFAF